MRSRDIFERPSKAVKPRKPIGLVGVMSLILPGSGHLLLGRSTEGLGLMVAALLALPASVAVRTFAPDLVAPLGWMLGRLGVIAAIYAVIDAPLRAREPRWRPTTRFAIPPRSAAAWNFAFYGVGHWKMDERIGAWTGFSAGAAAHIALVLFLPSGATIFAEVIPALLAAWAYHQANEIGSQRKSLLSDDDSGPGESVRPLAPLPNWLLPTQAFFVAALVASGVLLWIAHTHWLSSRTIDRSLAVVQEPFYRNPAYGLQLEMRAPGWSFRQDHPELFLEAVHIGARSRLRVQLAPRVPGVEGAASAETMFRETLIASGLRVQSVAIEPVAGDLAAYRLFATAMRKSQAREVAGLVYDQGFRRYLLHMEWAPDHADFGVAEWDYVLNGLTIGDHPFGTAVVAR